MNFDESTVNKIKRLEREVERLKAGSEKALPDGWIPVSSTWTYASATTITVPSGAASIYSVGDKIKLNNTDLKYFYIVGVADTVLTITGGSDYTLDSDAISAVYYSKAATPLGFPGWFNWTPTLTTGDADLSGLDVARFYINGRLVYFYFVANNRNVTGAAGAIFIGLPVAVTGTTNLIRFSAQIYPIGGAYVDVHCEVQNSYPAMALYKDMTGSFWVANETGIYIRVNGFYEAA